LQREGQKGQYGLATNGTNYTNVLLPGFLSVIRVIRG
jgi:hypothetical protein